MGAVSPVPPIGTVEATFDAARVIVKFVLGLLLFFRGGIHDDILSWDVKKPSGEGLDAGYVIRRALAGCSV